MSTGSCVDQNGKWNLGNRWLGCKMQGFSWQIDKSRKSMWAGAQQLEEHMELEPEPLPFCMGKCFNSLMCRMTIGEATCIFLPKSCVGKPSLFRISSIFPGEIRQKPTEWVGASKKNIHTWPTFLISLLFRIWAFLAFLDPVARKKQNLVGTNFVFFPMLHRVYVKPFSREKTQNCI